VSYLKIFFEENPVFTVNEFKNAFKEGRSIHTLQTQLKQYTKSGYIKPLRRGVYFVKGPTGSKSSPDEFMFASKLAPDGLIAYHSAFDLLGFGHSVFNSLYYFTSKRQHLLTFNSFRFVPLSYPVELTRKSNEGFGVEKVERLGKKILVTGKERTLVDVSITPSMQEVLKNCIIQLRRCHIFHLSCSLNILHSALGKFSLLKSVSSLNNTVTNSMLRNLFCKSLNAIAHHNQRTGTVHKKKMFSRNAGN
jgi:hypothetical protein